MINKIETVNKYQVSVTVLTYNADIRKLKLTLDSIISQRNIHFQIVISDDGSQMVHEGEILEYFESKRFTDFKLVLNKINKGTVINSISSIQNCDGEYIKSISPGDMLYGFDVLHDWYYAAKEHGWLYSFCDCVYYSEDEDGKISFLEEEAHPQNLSAYKSNDMELFRDDYLILEDICVGAADFFERRNCIKYFEQICNRVIYAEDNVWRLMAYDKIPFGWFDQNAILYEYGIGISTNNNSSWINKINNDFIATDDILRLKAKNTLEHQCSRSDSKFAKKVLICCNHEKRNLIQKVNFKASILFNVPERLHKKIYRMFHACRKTPIEIKQEFLESIEIVVKN